MTANVQRHTSTEKSPISIQDLLALSKEEFDKILTFVKPKSDGEKNCSSELLYLIGSGFSLKEVVSLSRDTILRCRTEGLTIHCMVFNYKIPAQVIVKMLIGKTFYQKNFAKLLGVGYIPGYIHYRDIQHLGEDVVIAILAMLHESRRLHP